VLLFKGRASSEENNTTARASFPDSRKIERQKEGAVVAPQHEEIRNIG
tara:strand:+ start:144 stop:287 length:144 start_codon:yes stop_codon:yes gene_type:complete